MSILLESFCALRCIFCGGKFPPDIYLPLLGCILCFTFSPQAFFGGENRNVVFCVCLQSAQHVLARPYCGVDKY